MDNLKQLRSHLLTLKKNGFTDVDSISIDGRFDRHRANDAYHYYGNIVGDGVVYAITTNKCNIPYEGNAPIYVEVTELIGKNVEGYNFVADFTGREETYLPGFYDFIMEQLRNNVEDENIKQLLNVRDFKSQKIEKKQKTKKYM